MSAFANVFVGNTANDGTGDTLRTAFQKIDQNFANIALTNATSPVMSVAGRKGNIVLSVNDVQGAASLSYVTIQTDAANTRTDSSISSALTNISTLVTAANTAARAYTDSSIASANIIVGNLSTLSANIGRIYANLDLLTQEVGNIGLNTTSGWLGTINFGIGFLSNSATWSNAQLSTLSTSITAVNAAVVANAATLGNTITAANTAVNSRVTDINSALLTAISTANTGVKSYVDGQVTTLVANDTVQSNALNSINANLGIVTANIVSLTANTIAQQSDIISIRQAGNVNASAILTANINVVNFVNDLNSAVIARVNAANTAIVTANTSLKSYTDTAISTAINNLVNSAPGTLDTLNEIAANLAAEGNTIGGLLSAVTLANSAILSLTTNAAGQANQITGANTAIVTANTAMKSYVDSIVTSLTANDTVQSSQIIGANAAIVTANTGMKSYVDGAVTTLTANAAVQDLAITGLRANITAANAVVTSVVGVFNTFSNVVTGNISNLETAVSFTNSNIITANANVVSYVNTLNSVMSGRLNAANINIATNKATIDQINTNITALTANVTTGFLSINGNVTAGNLRTGGAVIPANGIIFADGSRQTTAAGASALGNIAFSGYNITNSGDDGSNGITITPANGGEIHLKSYTGVNNVNPGYWLHVGDGSIGAPRNTANIAVDFYGNESVRGSVVWDYDWSANIGGANIGTNTASPSHTNFGLYRNGLYSLPMMVFEYASGNVTFGNTTVNKLTTTTGIFWPNGAAYSAGGAGSYGNTQVAAYLTTNPQPGTYSNSNVASYLSTYSGNIAANIVKNGYTWRFGTDGTLTLPVGGTITATGTAAVALRAPAGSQAVLENNAGYNLIIAQDQDVRVTTSPDAGSTFNTWNFTTDGNLTLPQTDMQASPQPASYPGITFTDGTFQTTAYKGSTYGNANVASYLTTATITTTGNITTIANVIAPRYLFANGVNILSTVSGSAYGNTQVSSLLTAYNGNLGVDGGQVTIYDSILDLHTYANLASWAADDGRDIGLRMHYYNGVDSLAFLGLENSSKTLQYLANATEVSGNVSGTFGNVKFGSLLLSNATPSTNYTTGALIVAGGTGVAGSAYIGGGVQNTPIGNATPSTGAFTTVSTTGNLTATGNVIVGANVLSTNANLTLRAVGAFNTLTLYNVAGGYNSPPYTAQTLTGGTGTGMTATYSSVGGYVSTISVVNPGTGYKNGDVLTLPGGLGSTVTLSNYNSNFTGGGTANYIFGLDGSLTTQNLITTGNLFQSGQYYETYSNVTNTGGNLTLNFVNGGVYYATLTANVTANIVGISNTTFTTAGFTVIVDQGATPYRIANIQFAGGTTSNIKWAGATVPTGTASNTDVISVSLINLNNGTYRILGQQSSYA